MFERYTPAAKLAIYMARLRGEAIGMRPAITPSYILAGLMTEGCLAPERGAPFAASTA